MPAEIEVLVYSGRDNPRGELDPSTEGELARRLSAMKPAEQPFEPGDGLGYRGLHIVSTSSEAMREVEISASRLRVHDRDGRTRVLADPDRGLERWLLEVLASRLAAGDRPVVEEILRQLNTGPGRGTRRQR